MNFTSAHLVTPLEDTFKVSLYSEHKELEYKPGNIYIVREYEVQSNETVIKIRIQNLSAGTTSSYFELHDTKRLIKIKMFTLKGVWQLRFEYADDRNPPNTQFLAYQFKLADFATFSEAIEHGITEVMKM